MLWHWVWVALGGALGSVMRYGATLMLNSMMTPVSSFPIGTLAVNGLGCLLIGVCWALLQNAEGAPAEMWRCLLMVGVLGGFTTFSTFALETVVLLQQQQWLSLSLYWIGSNVLGILFCILGYGLTRYAVGSSVI